MKLLLLHLILLSFILFSQSTICRYNVSVDPFSSASSLKQDGGPQLLYTVGKSFRESFFGTTLNYERLSYTISDIYQGTTLFSSGAFISPSLDYLSNISFLATLVFLLAIFMPLIYFIIWCYLEKCNQVDNDRETGDEDHRRHLSFLSQFATWLTGSCVIISLLLLIVFVITLCVGMERINHSLTGSAEVINETLPLLVKLHQDFLSTVNDKLIDDVVYLNNSIYTQLINPLPANISSNIKLTHYHDISQLFSNISLKLSGVDEAFYSIQRLTTFQQTLQSLSWTNLISNITQLIQTCSEFTNNFTNQTTLSWITCHSLVTNSSLYLPLSSPTLTSTLPNITTLQSLETVLYNVMNRTTPSSLDQERNYFSNFLTMMEYNISKPITLASSSYISSITDNLFAIGNNIHSQYGDITYGWPSSQDVVEYYLGPGYLLNWQEFHYVATVAFSLALIVLVVGVALAVGRGLINIGAIYKYGEDESYVRSSHQAALTLRKLAIWMSISGIVSAFFFIFLFCLASLVGRTCGPHNNYTELISDLIDNNDTWAGSYPLGTVYHHQPLYPLTLQSVLTACSKNSSSIKALQLYAPLNLSHITLTTMQSENFITEMKSVPESVLISTYSVLGTSLKSALIQYQNIKWSHVNISDLFQSNFGGITLLQQLITDLNISSINETHYFSSVFSQSLNNILSDLPTLVGVSEWYDMARLQAQSNVSLVSQVLEQTHDISVLINMSENFENTIRKTIYNTIKQITLSTATNITHQLEGFISRTHHMITCDSGTCYPVTEKYAQFSILVCTNLITGLDIHWMSLAILFIIILICITVMLILASRLLNEKILKSQRSNRYLYFSITDQILSQTAGVLWLSVAFAINIWLVVTIATDELFTQKCATTGECCIGCTWGSGIVFLVIAFPVALLLRFYQWILLHRIRVFQGSRVQQIQRYWLTRIKATLFYTHLCLFFSLHIPFLAIAGAYTSGRGLLSIAALSSLSVSLLGIVWFLIILIKEKKQLLPYMSLLQQELAQCCCSWRAKLMPSPPVSTTAGPNNTVPSTVNERGQVASGSDHSYEYRDEITGDVSPLPAYGHVSTLPHVPEVDEEEETVFGPDSHARHEIEEEGAAIQDEAPPPTYLHYEMPYPVQDDDIVVEPAVVKIPSRSLDRRLSDLESNFAVLQRREDAIHHTNGVEVANSWRSDGDKSNRSSIYTSQSSMTGSELPYSSSHIPGYTSTDESSTNRDGLDGYDSYDSDNPYSYITQFGGIRVEV